MTRCPYNLDQQCPGTAPEALTALTPTDLLVAAAVIRARPGGAPTLRPIADRLEAAHRALSAAREETRDD